MSEICLCLQSSIAFQGSVNPESPLSWVMVWANARLDKAKDPSTRVGEGSTCKNVRAFWGGRGMWRWDQLKQAGVWRNLEHRAEVTFEPPLPGFNRMDLPVGSSLRKVTIGVELSRICPQSMSKLVFAFPGFFPLVSEQADLSQS